MKKILLVIAIVCLSGCQIDIHPKVVKVKFMEDSVVSKNRIMAGTRVIYFLGEDGEGHNTFSTKLIHQVKALKLRVGDTVTMTVKGGRIQKIHGDYLK